MFSHKVLKTKLIFNNIQPATKIIFIKWKRQRRRAPKDAKPW
jgi:hypothetical protein